MSSVIPSRGDLTETLENLVGKAGSETDRRLPSERKLAETLGVSRKRLRSVLDELVARGLVFRRQGHGTFVAPPQPRNDPRARAVIGRVDIEHIMDVRLTVEPRLAECAAAQITNEGKKALIRAMERARDAASPEAYDLADEIFHYRIAEMAGNPLMLQLYELIRETRSKSVWRRRRAETNEPALISMLSEQHQNIVDAIISGRQRMAAGAVTEHLMFVVRHIGEEPASDMVQINENPLSEATKGKRDA